MAYTSVTLPLTGAGDATAQVAADSIGGGLYQVMKIADGIEGSTGVVPALSSAPNSTDVGLLVRPIGGGTTSVDAAATLTSVGSTRLVGQVTVANPTTGVTLSSGAILGGSTATIGEVTPTSAGSTRLIGQMTVANPTTEVTLSSGVILGAGSTANAIGSVALMAGTSANTIGNVTVSNLSTGGGGSTTVDANLTSAGSTKVVGTVNVSSGLILGGSTAMTGLISSGTQTIGSVQLTSAGTTGSIGSVALLAGSSANNIGQVTQGPGSSANGWFINTVPFSSASRVRTTANTSADSVVIAANAARRALVIQNLTTADIGLGLSTGAVTTAMGNVEIVIGARGGANNSNAIFGVAGQYPLFTGPIRGIIIGSTTVSGGVSVTEFS